MELRHLLGQNLKRVKVAIFPLISPASDLQFKKPSLYRLKQARLTQSLLVCSLFLLHLSLYWRHHHRLSCWSFIPRPLAPIPLFLILYYPQGHYIHSLLAVIPWPHSWDETITFMPPESFCRPGHTLDLCIAPESFLLLRASLWGTTGRILYFATTIYISPYTSLCWFFLTTWSM